MKRGLVLLFGGIVVTGCNAAPVPEKPASPAIQTTDTSAHGAQKIAATEKPMVLDDLIAFSDASICAAEPATRELLDHLLVRKNEPEAIKKSSDNELVLGNVIAPARFHQAFGKLWLRKGDNGFTEATLPLSGTWHGLKMAEIASSGVPIGDEGFWTYRFHEPFERVRTVLNAMGFGFDREGRQPLDPLEGHIHASLFVVDGMTALDCEPIGTPPTKAESDRRAAKAVL